LAAEPSREVPGLLLSAELAGLAHRELLALLTSWRINQNFRIQNTEKFIHVEFRTGVNIKIKKQHKKQ
jgi:hypothetical protein